MGKFGISINLNHLDETRVRRRHLTHKNDFNVLRSPVYDSAGYYDPNTFISHRDIKPSFEPISTNYNSDIGGHWTKKDWASHNWSDADWERRGGSKKLNFWEQKKYKNDPNQAYLKQLSSGYEIIFNGHLDESFEKLLEADMYDHKLDTEYDHMIPFTTYEDYMAIPSVYMIIEKIQKPSTNTVVTEVTTSEEYKLQLEAQKLYASLNKDNPEQVTEQNIILESITGTTSDETFDLIELSEQTLEPIETIYIDETSKPIEPIYIDETLKPIEPPQVLNNVIDNKSNIDNAIEHNFDEFHRKNKMYVKQSNDQHTVRLNNLIKKLDMLNSETFSSQKFKLRN